MALGLGALSLAGLVGAGVGLSTNNNVRADEVKADDLSTGLYFPCTDNDFSTSADKLFFDSGASSDMFGWFYYKTVDLNAGDKFKIYDDEHYDGDAGWIDEPLSNIQVSFSKDNDGNFVCPTDGTYSITYWYSDYGHKGIWNIVEGDYVSPTLTGRDYMWFVTEFEPSTLNLYSFGKSENLGAFPGKSLSDSDYFDTLSFKYLDKYIVKFPKSKLGGDNKCIVSANGSNKSVDFEFNSDTIYQIQKGENYYFTQLISNEDRYYASSLLSAMDLVGEIDNAMGEYDSTFGEHFSKSICAISQNQAKEFLKSYHNVKYNFSGRFTIETYQWDSINNNYNESSKGSFELDSLIGKFEVFAEGQKNVNVPTPSVNLMPSGTIITVALVSLGVTAGIGAFGFLLRRKGN